MKSKNTVFLLLILILIITLICVVAWQLSGLIPQQVSLLYPESNVAEIAPNQLFVTSPDKSHPAKTISGCVYFPNLYDANGKYIITTQGTRGPQNVRFMELGLNGDFPVHPGDEVTLKVSADCFVLGQQIWKPVIFEKKYTVKKELMTTQEKITAQTKAGVDPSIIEMMQQAEEMMKQVEQKSEDSSIQVEFPYKDQSITSPLTITGKAKGSWYFEGSFPVVLLAENGKILAQGAAKAQGDWMTEDFVPFKTELTFTKSAKNLKGKVVFKKDNPSGLPENDASFEVPVSFK
jgi:hypothetical protein